MAVFRGGTKVRITTIIYTLPFLFILHFDVRVAMFTFSNRLMQVVRSFRPDFVLIRQPPRDGSRDYRSTLLGLKFGGVPCINSLNSVYQFQVTIIFFDIKMKSPLKS